ncbi:hypothetical protein [uncultured Methanobrevibacter sp.]|uniref:hypothetical protein n=1 Tax=uncultured Methanobrevibacter sp. TaxID=253161 RepID=UPI0025CF6E9F|nr:hypothetical protein [uncultured Methanobrevibacter sp.]
MSSYIKLIIFIAVLILISAAVIFVESSTDDVNKSMHIISDGIVTGDSEYNEAVDLVNSKRFSKAMEKAESAGDNFNSSLKTLHKIRNNSPDINDVHSKYIDNVISEVEFKLQAVSLLEEAIESFKIHSNYTGTNYANQANDLMNQAVEYQNIRDSIVQNNSDLFKQDFNI